MGTGRKQPKVQEGSLQVTNARRARRAVADGQYKKAMQVLAYNGIGEESEEVFQELLSKHPQADPLTPSSDFVPPSIMISRWKC